MSQKITREELTRRLAAQGIITHLNCADRLDTKTAEALEAVVKAGVEHARDLTGFGLLDKFRALVRREVERALARDGYHKRFEGEIQYSVQLPPVVDWSDMPDPMNLQPEMSQQHVLRLACYVIGPSRAYSWHGVSAQEVFAKATADFIKWAREDAEP